MVVKAIEDKAEVIKRSIDLIWEATEEKVTSITFNNQSRSAAMSFDDDRPKVLNLNPPDVVLLDGKDFVSLLDSPDKDDSNDPGEERIDELKVYSV